MWLHDLRDADDEHCGGKARRLARLIAAGLPVPEGFVIDDRAFRSVVGELAIDSSEQLGHAIATAERRIAEAPAGLRELETEVLERGRQLGQHVMVRSSATIEDTAEGAAAGVYTSCSAVPLDAVWSAIRSVWLSALTPLAIAYARRRGAGPLGSIGVIIQEYVPGTPVVVYTRPPGYPDSHELLIQRAGSLSRHSRDDLPREIEAQHAALLALRAEQALAEPRGVDVELIQIRKQSGFDVAIDTVVVQARPIVHPTPNVLAPPPPAVLAPLEDGRTWTWDVAHNPDPLSPAQQGLVERVERAGLAPWSLRVCAGFLYSAPRGEPPPSVHSAGELRARAKELEARLERLLTDEPLALAEAVERYLAFYAIWARELSPLIAAARAVLPARLAADGVPNPEALATSLAVRPASEIELTLREAARGSLDDHEVMRRLGVLAPAWDVAAPTYGERAGVLEDAIARVRKSDAAAEAASAPAAVADDPALAEARQRYHDEIELARAAAELAEHDDMLFARAQWLVRRALLARSAELGLRGDDVFWLPLDDVMTRSVDPDDAHRRAAGARAAATRAARWQMPIVVGSEPPSAGEPLRGVGTGPRVAGRVVRYASLASAVAVGPRDVVVTRAVTPALAVLVAGCAALVSETGGLLDHGAALARELGIPCVVGCRHAWTTLSDGMLVTVDGDGGTVTPASPGETMP